MKTTIFRVPFLGSMIAKVAVIFSCFLVIASSTFAQESSLFGRHTGYRQKGLSHSEKEYIPSGTPASLTISEVTQPSEGVLITASFGAVSNLDPGARLATVLPLQTYRTLFEADTPPTTSPKWTGWIEKWEWLKMPFKGSDGEIYNLESRTLGKKRALEEVTYRGATEDSDTPTTIRIVTIDRLTADGKSLIGKLTIRFFKEKHSITEVLLSKAEGNFFDRMIAPIKRDE